MSAATSPDDPAFGSLPIGLPERVGPYRILDVLGEGAMGVVYLAEEREPVRRRVALKLIKHGMDSGRVLKRFEAERQALAMMAHENIAKVFFAGATDDGRPYFVMEYVKGVPISHFCNDHGLGVRERIEVFLQVCAGVQHAHQKGVIHRDIKPSNVLVIDQDGALVPKIIDFGLARATDHLLHDRTVYTEHGTVVGTPEYMSPEQAGVTNLDVDTRTDVYSLGAVLYELLTGVRPYLLGGLRQLGRVDEILRIIHEDDPPTPSSRVASGSAMPNLRADEARGLQRHLRGDLDWITMKALAKDRMRRYQSASELAADLRRHLDDEPVAAGPPSARYRALKFVRRHRAGAAAAAVVAVVLAASAVAFAILWVGAVQARETSERQSTRAASVKGFLQQMLWPDELDWYSAPRADVRLSELLAKSVELVAAAPPADPAIEAEICELVGMAYRSLGHYPTAAQHLARAQQLSERADGPNSDRHLDIKLRHAIAVERTGHKQEAGEMLREVLDACQARHGDADPRTLSAATSLAINLKECDLARECADLAARTLPTARAAFGPDDLLVGHLTELLGWCHMRNYDFQEAEQAYSEAEHIVRLHGDPDDPRVLRIENNLADFFIVIDRPDRAEPLLRHARTCVEQSLGPKHAQTLTVLSNLGKCRSLQGDFEEAVQLWRTVADERMRALADPAHPEVQKARFYLGVGLGQAKRSEEAEELLRAALAVADAGAPSIFSVLHRQALGRVLVETERAQEATEVLEAALKLAERVMQRDPVGRAKLQVDAGQACQAAGQGVRARELLDAALAVLAGKLPDNHRTMVKARECLARLR